LRGVDGEVSLALEGNDLDLDREQVNHDGEEGNGEEAAAKLVPDE